MRRGDSRSVFARGFGGTGKFQYQSVGRSIILALLYVLMSNSNRRSGYTVMSAIMTAGYLLQAKHLCCSIKNLSVRAALSQSGERDDSRTLHYFAM